MKLSLKAKQVLHAALMAGAAAAIVNILIYLIMIAVGGHDWSVMIMVSILMASLLPNLIAAVAYYGLSRLTDKARPILTIGVAAFVLISILPHLGIGPAPSPALAALPEGFDLLTVPLHIVFGLTAVTVMPWLASKEPASGTA